ncbi:TPA: hypothetical protein HA219_01380 [Candidatus Woesearchaeota archaeon]|nr:hypothetical protein [Candidatus Woesearchaeota archaeon]HIH39358.1 hypothetical protein [Candidatus Woesearchaeota archaeon]
MVTIVGFLVAKHVKFLTKVHSAIFPVWLSTAGNLGGTTFP